MILKKKILYVITKSVWGGAQRYVYDLATNIPKDRFEVTVAAGGSGPLFDKLQKAGIRTITIPGFQRNINLMKEFSSFWQLLKVFREEKPEVIHLNSTKAGGLGAIAAFVYKLLTLNFKPLTIFTVHGWGFHENRHSIAQFFIFFASWLSSFFQDKIIIISSADLRSAASFIPRSKLTYIPHGIKMETLPLSRKEARAFLSRALGLHLSTKTYLLGSIAELTKNKGLEHLIRAIHHVKSEREDIEFRLLIAGEGEEKEKLENVIRSLGLENHVSLIGFLPDAWKYLRGFNAFILPSLKEGLPYTIMEAMASGLPVVATHVGGIPDLIEHGVEGYVVPPRDEKLLAKHIHELTRDRKMGERLGMNGRKKIEEGFKLRPMIEKTIACYERPLAQ